MAQMKSILLCLVVIFLFSDYSVAESVILTDAEKEFIESHPIITIGVDPEFVPFEFLNSQGDYVGITADYLKLITESTGLEFEIVEDLTWVDAYDLALNGKIDALPAVSKTTEREKSFLFSDPYYYFQRVIVVKDTDDTISGIETLENMTVAVQANSSHHSYLINYPSMNLSLYQSAEGAISAVARGDEKAYVGNMATINYIIRSRGITGLKIEKFREDERFSLHVAVRKDWPQLISILNKGFATISEEEKNSINSKWIDLDTSYKYRPLIRTLIFGSSIIVLILGISAFWILKLKKEIEKRKEIESNLVRAEQEAVDANQIKSNFLARMSHEIRTPLNAIMGMSYLIKKTDLSAGQKQYIDKIGQASKNMLQIINDILDFSKIEAGKINLESISFNLDQVFQDVVNIVSYKVEEQKIQLSFMKDPNIPTFFWGDPVRLQQVLLNIINNAVKFTNEGEVRLEVDLIELRGDICKISFCVKDTGIGMTDEQVDKLFEPFTQADSTINRRFGGTGLGLSIVKNLVQLMNGELAVKSQVENGTEFCIQIPLEVDREKENQFIEKKKSTTFKSIYTLVLSHTVELQNQLGQYLNAFGMSCEFTTSYDSFMTTIEMNGIECYDLLIIDYDALASMTSFNDLLRKATPKPKVLALLPMMRDDLFDQLDALGIDVGIGKPVIPSVLYDGLLELFKSTATDTEQYDLEDSQGSKAKENKHMTGQKILLVEDNKTNQFIAQSILEEVGYQLIIADNGLIGVELFKKYWDEIDLILMDLHMPIMNGYEASLRIREIDANIPIMAMTADAISGIEAQCKIHGINHYLSKPFDPDELLIKINKILEDNSKVGEALPAINRSIGMKYTGNNEILFDKILKSFYEECKDTVTSLERSLQNEDFEAAKQIIHKVKGTAGTIGATDVYNLCKSLQKSIENHNLDKIADEFRVFSVQFKKLMLEIEVIFK